MNRILLILLVSFISSGSKAQDSDRSADSLKRLLSGETQDSSRSLLLGQLAKCYTFSKPDTALLLAEHGLALAKLINYPKGEATCLCRVGFVLAETGNYPKALEDCLEALKIGERVNDPVLVSMA